MTETEYATNVQARFPRCFTAEGLANPAALAKRENAAMHRAIGQYQSSQREYVPPAPDNENMAAAKAAIIAKGETTRADILRVLTRPLTCPDVSHALKRSPQLINRHLVLLEAAGKVTGHKTKGIKVWRPV